MLVAHSATVITITSYVTSPGAIIAIGCPGFAFKTAPSVLATVATIAVGDSCFAADVAGIQACRSFSPSAPDFEPSFSDFGFAASVTFCYPFLTVCSHFGQTDSPVSI